METVVKKLYEAMFLVDSAQAASDWEGINETIKNILEKAEADVVSIEKWDERELCYKIDGKSRGTYILCYFRVEGERVREIEREVQLSERIMRVLILNAEAMSQEDIKKDTPARRVEKRLEKAAQDAAARAEAESSQAAEAEAEADSTPEVESEQAVKEPALSPSEETAAESDIAVEAESSSTVEEAEKKEQAEDPAPATAAADEDSAEQATKQSDED